MKKTVPYINNLKGNRVISMMTAYDYPTAKAVSEAEIDIILVGDSAQLGQPLQGAHPGESGSSVLDYLLQGKDTISDQEYADSKKITFRLLYGGIDKDFEKIPFFGKTKSYI